MNIEQLKKDVENGVLISKSTWAELIAAYEGSQFAAKQHLQTVEVQAKIISTMQERINLASNIECLADGLSAEVIDLRARIAATAIQAQPNDLHAAIMNLPHGSLGGYSTAQSTAYRMGHKDARHAAADLVAASGLIQAQLLTDADIDDDQIIGVLHSFGIDTSMSVYGFDSLQVSATNVPRIKDVVRACIACIKSGVWPTPKYHFDSSGYILRENTPRYEG